MINFSGFTDRELYSIWCSMDKNEWNDLLGRKPVGFDNLPEDFCTWRCHGSVRICKRTYTEPIKSLVSTMLGVEKLREFQNRGRFRSMDEWNLYRALEDTYPVGYAKEHLELVFEHFRDNT